MSVQSAQKFVDKFNTDANFKKSIEAAPSDAQKQKIVTAAGFDFTKSDLKVVNQKGIDSLGDDVALPQSSGTWVGVGAGAGGAAAAGVGAGAGIAAAVTAGASASAAI